jgi:hypothetical protein
MTAPKGRFLFVLKAASGASTIRAITIEIFALSSNRSDRLCGVLSPEPSTRMLTHPGPAATNINNCAARASPPSSLRAARRMWVLSTMLGAIDWGSQASKWLSSGEGDRQIEEEVW